MSNSNERRQFASPRINARLRVELAQYPGTIYYTVNISQTGCLIQMPQNIQTNQMLSLKIHIPSLASPITVSGRSSRIFTKEGTQFVGIQILEISSVHRTLWLDYIEKLESFTSEDNQPTSTNLALKRKNKQGTQNQTFVVRFEGLNQINAFVTENIQKNCMIITHPMSKTPGDEVNIVLVHPIKQTLFELKSEVMSQAQSNVLGLPKQGVALKFKNFNDELMSKLLAFVHS